MTSLPVAEIRAKRELINVLIAAHDQEGLRAHMTDDVVLVGHDGPVFHGADAVVAAFAGQFADPAFVTYARTTGSVEVAASGLGAAERGRWVGSWSGGIKIGGVYLAAWREDGGQWRLERELYVTLTD